MFYICSTETWLEKRNNDINDPSSLNPGGICDSGWSLNGYLHTPVIHGNAFQNWLHIYQLSRLNIQRCMTYKYVHVCGYLFSTVVCCAYFCLFVYTCTSVCSMRIPSCIDILPGHLFVHHVLIFFLCVYLLNKWFLISDFHKKTCIICCPVHRNVKRHNNVYTLGPLARTDKQTI